MLNMSISLGKRQLVDSIWKSAGIEGVGTTFPILKNFMRIFRLKQKREVLFIINMKNAWYFLFENIELPNNLMFLRGLNRICMKDLSFDAGNIRTLPVSIGRTYWKPEQSREEVILSELDEIDKISDKMDSAVEMFCFITRTQMFLDGNKRVAQLMCNKILMENDIGILSIPYEKIGQFKELLVNFYESNNQTMLKAF